MMVTNQERVREFRGTSMQVFGGGMFTAVNLHVHVMNFTIDALATVGASLKGENFVYDGMFASSRCITFRRRVVRVFSRSRNCKVLLE